MIFSLLFILMMSFQVSLFMNHEKIAIDDLWTGGGERPDLLRFESVLQNISTYFFDKDYMTKDL